MAGRRLWWVLAVVAFVATGCTGYVWGDNSFGQLGDGTTGIGSSSSVPIVEASASEWFVLAAGEWHTCGVKQDLSLWCWGRNDRGQIGNGVSGTVESSPVQVGAGNTWLNVFPGFDHTCAIDTTKRLWCWGRNSAGQIGDGTVTNRLTPTQVGTASDWNWATLSAFSTCGIRSIDELYCWGSNSFGELGLGDTTDRIVPVQVAGTWSTVDGGGRHFCAITATKELQCWGSNTSGQIGDSSTIARSTPTPVVMVSTGGNVPAADVQWTTVSAGQAHTCGLYDYSGSLAVTGDLACWGSNDHFQLGFVEADFAEVVIDATNYSSYWLDGWSRITAGFNHSCGVQDGTLKCWGDNNLGQLGDNTTTARSLPTPVALPDAWVSVSAGRRHTVGTRNTN